MRVVHVTEVSAGGVRRMLRAFAADQLRRGYDVHLVGDESLAELPGTHHPWNGSRHRALQAPVDVWRLRRLLDRLEPDVVHLHSFFAGAFGRLRLRRPPYPVVYQPHGWAFDAVRSGVARWGVVGFERWAGRRTAVLATNCSDEIADARAHGILTLAVPVGVPVDLGWFSPASVRERKEIRADLGLDDQPVLLCMGRLARQKGYDVLVREWERNPISGAVLYLVGAGSPRPLAALAPTQWGRTVHAIGETDDPRQWFQAADLMLLPSRYEGQSVAVSEALACGLPVVAFAVNGARAAITDGGDPAGAVVPVGDARAMLAEAERRLSEPFVREAESVVARSRAERDSDPQAILDRLASVYQAALRRTARAAEGASSEGASSERVQPEPGEPGPAQRAEAEPGAREPGSIEPVATEPGEPTPGSA